MLVGRPSMVPLLTHLARSKLRWREYPNANKWKQALRSTGTLCNTDHSDLMGLSVNPPTILCVGALIRILDRHFRGTSVMVRPKTFCYASYCAR